MAAGVYDIYIEQGATFEFSLIYRDQITEVPIDLTGHQGRGQIRPSARKEILAEFVVTVTDAAAGAVNVELPATALEGIDLKKDSYDDVFEAVYDIELYDAAGGVIRLLNGKAEISPEVTR